MKPRAAAIVLLVLATALVAGRAWAQFSQYVPAGEFEEERESVQVRLDRAMKASRWRLGRFFIDPWVGVRDVSYVDNVLGTSGSNPQSDITAKLGVGLRLYRPIGGEMTFAAHALPEYVWWQDLSERRRLNGRYGAGLFGNLGRTGVEISATREEDSTFYSREVETRVNTRYDVGRAALELELGAGIALFAGGEMRQIRFLDADDPLLAELDFVNRDEEILRLGLRFSPAAGLSIGLGVEESVADFVGGARDRSNSGTSPILQLEFEGTRFDLGANLALRELEPEPGSAFTPFEEVTGDARLQLTIGGRLRPQLYANRNLIYALEQRWTYFEDSAIGLGLHTSLGSAASLRLFAEQRTNDYTATATGLLDRRDDLDVFGADLRLNFGRYTVHLGATRTQYDSSLPGLDRDITVIRSGLTLGSGSGSTWD